MVHNKQLSEKGKNSHQEFSVEGSLEPAGTDTDSGLSGSIRGDASKGLVRGTSEGLSEESSSPPCQSPKEDCPLALSSKMSISPSTPIESPDAGVAWETAHGRTFEVWKLEEEEAAPLQFKIEEHIEEITTHHITDEESNSNDSGDSDPLEWQSPPDKMDNRAPDSWESSKPKYTFRRRRFATKIESDATRNLLPAFDLPSISDESVSNSARVPFPELGVDLLPESSDTVDGGPSELVLESSDWKDNWLFRREKYRTTPTGQSVDTITMLIPNPSSEVTPTIGDRDIDELSELSDRHSTVSFDVSSDEEFGQGAATTQLPSKASKDLLELVGEISAEFGQKDQEYTEDTTILDRLHMTNSSNSVRTTRVSSTHLNGHLDSEVTDVTPVPKPRKHSLGNQPPIQLEGKSTSSISKISTPRAPMSKSNHSNFQTPSIALTPPESVPHVLDNSSSYSPSVWFESFSEDHVIPTGRTLRITCQIRAKQMFELNWYYRNELLHDGKGVLTWKKGDTYHLNVFEMTEMKAGTYIMCAYTRDDCVWAKCQVLCIDQGRVNKVPSFTLALSDTITEAGSDVTLECQVGGHPEPKVTFLRNSVPLISSENCFIENDQYGTWNVHLLGVEEGHGGQIKAIASNFHGHAMTFCDLSVVPEGQFVDQYFNNANKTRVSQISWKKKKPASQLGNNKTKDLTPTPASTLSNYCEDDNELANNSNESSFINSCTDYQSYSHRHNRKRIDVSMDTIDGGHNNREITVNGCLFQPPKPGTIAEREHRKWLEAKPLANNPYSPEKLASRLGQMSSRFPSLPAVCRDTSGDESPDPYLGEGLMSSSSDLSRYSRDYHVNSAMAKRESKLIRISKHGPDVKEILRTPTCLVKIEPQKSSADWREELKDIKLDVGKKVADIQKTIDECQHEWERRLQQKGWNPYSRKRDLKHKNQKLSSSCINLSTPPKSKSSVWSSKGRHLVYSSTEALNSTKHKENRNHIWRTVSVDTLNPPPKFSLMSSDITSDHRINHSRRFDSKESIDSKRRLIMSDSDDSSIPCTSYVSVNSGALRQMEDKSTFQNGHANKRLTSYYSENSIESLKEESDTEESSSPLGDNSNLPSVKELASKFDSAKSTRNRTTVSRKVHEKPLRSSRNRDILIIEQRDQNDSIVPPYNSSGYSKRFNDKITMTEVHHSLTARSVSRSFREGLRMHTQKTPSALEPLTDESIRFLNQECLPTERDTASPEHLGIPSSPASIPTRHQYLYPPPGDTSDDSTVASLTPRKNYRKKTSGGSASRLTKNAYIGEYKREGHI